MPPAPADASGRPPGRRSKPRSEREIRLLGELLDDTLMAEAVGLAVQGSVMAQLSSLDARRRATVLRMPFCLGYVLGAVTEHLSLVGIDEPARVDGALAPAFALLHGSDSTEVLTLALAGRGARHEPLMAGMLAGALDVRLWSRGDGEPHRLADGLWSP